MSRRAFLNYAQQTRTIKTNSKAYIHSQDGTQTFKDTSKHLIDFSNNMMKTMERYLIKIAENSTKTMS